jgi:hypothetical protein
MVKDKAVKYLGIIFFLSSLSQESTSFSLLSQPYRTGLKVHPTLLQHHSKAHLPSNTFSLQLGTQVCFCC